MLTESLKPLKTLHFQLSALIILYFPLLAPRKFLVAKVINLRFSDPSEMTQIADKLRWYLYKHALLQSEMADRIGIARKTNMRYEEYGQNYYPIMHTQKRARMYSVPVESLLDDYIACFSIKAKESNSLKPVRN